MFKWAEDMNIFPNKTQMSTRFHITDHQGNAHRAPKQRPPRACQDGPHQWRGRAETWARGGPCTLLVMSTRGGRRGKQDVTERTTRWPSSSTSGQEPGWNENTRRFTHQGRCSIIYSSQDAKATRVSTDRCLNFKSYTYTHTHRNTTQPLTRATSCHVQQNGWPWRRCAEWVWEADTVWSYTWDPHSEADSTRDLRDRTDWGAGSAQGRRAKGLRRDRLPGANCVSPGPWRAARDRWDQARTAHLKAAERESWRLPSQEKHPWLRGAGLQVWLLCYVFKYWITMLYSWN